MCKVSIIIPCYNVDSKLLHRCLTSIESQTFSDYEVIVVDDGSASGYSEVFHEIENEYRNLSVFYQENKGVSGARNFGLGKSRGDFITYVDADDYLCPAFLEEAIAVSEAHSADIVIGMNMTTHTTDTMEFTTEGNKKISCFENDEIKDINRWMLGRVQYQGDASSYLGQGPWNRLVSRRLAVSTLFDESLPIGEDIVWNLQLLHKARMVCIVSRIWYIYYMNPSSSSRKYRENAIKESYDSLMKMRKYLDLDDDEQYLSYCLRCWSDLKRIYRCYISHNYKECFQQKKDLFRDEPWYALASKRFRRLSGLKHRFKRELYISHLLFEYYHVKEMFTGKRI